MKQIIAILRDERVEDTKEALETIGVRGVMFLYVTGRGQQEGGGSTREPGSSLNRNLGIRLPGPGPGNEPPDARAGVAGSSLHPDAEFAFGFLPKRMLVIVACDEEVSRIVKRIVNANRTGRHGDGRIFICPMISAIRVRTGEQGNNALF